MLRATTFSKATAYFGIVINIMVFLFFVLMVGMYSVLLSTAGFVVLQIVVGLRLMRVARGSRA